MSTLKRGDLEQFSLIDLDPLVGLHRPSPHSSPPGGSSPAGSSAGSSSPTSQEESGEEGGWKEDLCHAISKNKWNDAKAILDQNPNALTAEITYEGKTTIHVAAMIGHVTIVEELLKLLPSEFLLTGDSNGNTALILACLYSGIAQVARCLVQKKRGIVRIPDMHDCLPVSRAFMNNHQEMGRYLYSVTPLECLKGRWGSNLLRVCLTIQCFDIALNLLQRCEELLLVANDDGGQTPIDDIATLNTAIPNPSELIFWKRWIYNYINIPSTTNTYHVCVDIQQEDTSQGNKAKLTEPGIRELKLLHAQANNLLSQVCQNARKAYHKGVIHEPLLLAAKRGNVEFVFQVSKAIPEILLSNILFLCFHEALECRQAKVFNLIHGLRNKNSLITSADDGGNILMHKAAIKAPDHVLNRIYAPTLHMQQELQWFKEVESLTPPGYREFRNNDGLTAEELFKQSHKELMREGEKWIKATSSSCSVVGTLIVTIMFAAAFTVPGGNNQDFGYPLFIEQPFFRVFIFSTIVSLLSSSTSVLMFLAILTSHYSEEKFLKSLPRKLIIGLSFLFISVVCMIIAFLSTIRLMLKSTDYSWSLLPIIILASLPVFLFVLSQLPLLLHTYVSTYGNIFDRNVKPWP